MGAISFHEIKFFIRLTQSFVTKVLRDCENRAWVSIDEKIDNLDE